MDEVYDAPVTIPGMEEVTAAEEMDEFLSRFLVVFDEEMTDLVGDTMEWEADGNPTVDWTDEDKMSLLRELTVSFIGQAQMQAVVAVPWSQLFFDELAVGLVTGLRGFFLGWTRKPRTEDGQQIVAERLGVWSDNAVEVLIAWMEGMNTDE